MEPKNPYAADLASYNRKVPVKVEPQDWVLADKIKEAAKPWKFCNSLGIYGIMTADGAWYQNQPTVCHAGILYSHRSFSRDEVCYLLGITPVNRLKPKNRTADIEYYRWLLGPDSPYRSIVKDFNPDPEFALDYGIVVGDLDTAPSNVIYHFFIATRLVYEANLGGIWWKFVQQGLHPAMAFLATYTPEMKGNHPSHCAFPITGVTTQWLRNFGKGTPARVSGPYRTTDTSGGADSTWGVIPASDRVSYVPGATCWDEWAESYPEDVTPRYTYALSFHWHDRVNYGPRKPIATRFRPRNRESGLKILRSEQEKLFG